MKVVKDIFGVYWYVNEDHIVVAKKVTEPTEILKLTGRDDLKKCYILYMSNNTEIVIENMI